MTRYGNNGEPPGGTYRSQSDAPVTRRASGPAEHRPSSSCPGSDGAGRARGEPGTMQAGGGPFGPRRRSRRSSCGFDRLRRRKRHPSNCRAPRRKKRDNTAFCGGTFVSGAPID